MGFLTTVHATEDGPPQSHFFNGWTGGVNEVLQDSYVLWFIIEAPAYEYPEV